MSFVKQFVLVGVVTLLMSFNANANLEIGIFAKNEGRYDIALKSFQPLVDLGYGAAQFQLGEMYEFGLGLKKDPKMAADLFLKSANQGYAEAQFKVYRLYLEGNIFSKNQKEAVKWLKKSANLGLAAAEFNLAVMYHNGEVVLLDYKKAYYWYKQAAFQNYILAQFNLALMYYEGYGVKKSNSMSYVWNTIAGQNGYKKAFKSREVDQRNLLGEEIKLARMKVKEVLRKIELKRPYTAVAF